MATDRQQTDKMSKPPSCLIRNYFIKDDLYLHTSTWQQPPWHFLLLDKNRHTLNLMFMLCFQIILISYCSIFNRQVILYVYLQIDKGKALYLHNPIMHAYYDIRSVNIPATKKAINTSTWWLKKYKLTLLLD